MFLPPGTEEGYVGTVLKKCGNPIQAGVDEGLRTGVDHKKREWEDKATEWQSEVERWVLADKAVMGPAKKAWGSHLRVHHPRCR